jgi:hypothetical protein
MISLHELANVLHVIHLKFEISNIRGFDRRMNRDHMEGRMRRLAGRGKQTPRQ